MSRGNEAPLVTADWIADRLDDPGVRLVEVDVSPASYDQGHIPGAAFWDAYADLRDASYQPVERVELERLICRSGIERETALVFYGYGAALGYFLMKAHGHPDVRMLAGPRDQWSDAGGAWSTEVEAGAPAPTVSRTRAPRSSRPDTTFRP